MSLTMQSVPLMRRRFFPLHLKLMLSYLALASVILALASFYSFNQAGDRSAQESSLRMDESYNVVKQEFDRRLERSLAVVNLAAETPNVMADIASRGVVAMGPATGSDGRAIPDRAVASYITDVNAYFNALGLSSLQSGRAYSGLTVKDGRPQATVLSPVKNGGATVGLLSVSVDASSAVDVIKGGPDRAYWIFLDGAHWNGPAVAIFPLSGQDLNALAQGQTIARTTSAAGTSLRKGFYPLAGLSGKTAAALVVEEPAQGSSGSNSPLLGLVVAALSIGLFIAHYLARLVSRPVERITEASQRMAAGEAINLPPQKRRDELSVLSDNFNNMSREISLEKQRSDQMATLLMETQHRIANNLAALSSVLSMQLIKSDSPEAIKVIGDNLTRINSIAQVQRLLTGKTNSDVEIVNMIRQVALSTVAANSAAEIGLEVRGPEFKLPAKLATSLAIIINELIINSMKHGFGGQGGHVSIFFNRESNDIIRIGYRDTGSESTGPKATSGQGLGTQIINNLVRDDLGGDWDISFDNGCKADIRLPLPA